MHYFHFPSWASCAFKCIVQWTLFTLYQHSFPPTFGDSCRQQRVPGTQSLETLYQNSFILQFGGLIFHSRRSQSFASDCGRHVIQLHVFYTRIHAYLNLVVKATAEPFSTPTCRAVAKVEVKKELYTSILLYLNLVESSTNPPDQRDLKCHKAPRKGHRSRPFCLRCIPRAAGLAPDRMLRDGSERNKHGCQPRQLYTWQQNHNMFTLYVLVRERNTLAPWGHPEAGHLW